MYERRGLSIVELLVCLAIVILVFAITFPVLTSARKSSRTSASVSALRNIYGAIAIYREQHGGGSPNGKNHAMALPDFQTVRSTGLGLTQDAWQSPCGHPDRELFASLPTTRRPRFLIEFDYMPSDTTTWQYYTQNEGENSILVADLNCDPHRMEMKYSSYRQYHSIGLYLGGHIRSVRRSGNPHDLTYWCTVPDCLKAPGL